MHWLEDQRDLAWTATSTLHPTVFEKYFTFYLRSVIQTYELYSEYSVVCKGRSERYSQSSLTNKVRGWICSLVRFEEIYNSMMAADSGVYDNTHFMKSGVGD